MSVERAFLDSAVARMEAVKAKGDGALAQVDDVQLFHRADPEANSIAILVQHLHGNMLSRWTDFLDSDGDKPWRKRDEEFEPVVDDAAEVRRRWEEGWKLCTDTIAGLQPGDVMREVAIRGQPLTVMECILRQVAHYSYHVGQMVTLSRQLVGKDWQTLSIARGKSAEYRPKKGAGGITE